jgi:hypothetical protein
MRAIIASAFAATLALFPVASDSLRAQAARGGGIRIVRSSQISTANPKSPHVESHIAVDPADPTHLIATSHLLSTDANAHSRAYVTFDGGKTWSQSRAMGDSALITGGDPVVYFNQNRTAFFSTLARPKGLRNSRTLLSRSTDGGRTWQPYVVVASSDRQYIAFDTAGRSSLSGRLYLTGMNDGDGREGGQVRNIILMRSDDDGRTFALDEMINRDEGGADQNELLHATAGEPVVTAGGALAIPYTRWDMSLGYDPNRPNESRIGMIVSDNGGRTFSAARLGPTMHVAPGFRARQAASPIRSAVSHARGPHRNRIYVTWPEYDESTDRYMVKIAYTSDLGVTWRTTVVTDNATGGEPGNPAVAVNKDGVVAVIWNDRRDDPKNACWRLYGAISVDGGDSFLPNVKLSEKPSCPNVAGNWKVRPFTYLDDYRDPSAPTRRLQLVALVPVRWPNGGDTQGLVADRTGDFHAGWINGETGVLQLWYTRFSVDPSLTEQMRSSAMEQVAAKQATPLISLAGREDVTNDLELNLSDATIDFATRTLSVTVRVSNPTGRDFRGPLDLVVAEMFPTGDQGMGLKNLRAANADSGGTGIGARWSLSAGPSNVLKPGAKTPPRRFVFSFDGGIPEQPEGYFEPGLRIYARKR